MFPFPPSIALKDIIKWYYLFVYVIRLRKYPKLKYIATISIRVITITKFINFHNNKNINENKMHSADKNSITVHLSISHLLCMY